MFVINTKKRVYIIGTMKKELHPKLKEVFPKAIEAYEDAIRNMPEESWEEWHDYLCKLDMELGICMWADEALGVHIYNEMADINSGHWFDEPGLSMRRSEAIRLLQLRVDRMKELLNEAT